MHVHLLQLKNIPQLEHDLRTALWLFASSEFEMNLKTGLCFAPVYGNVGRPLTNLTIKLRFSNSVK
jgi:hypothetical protein